MSKTKTAKSEKPVADALREAIALANNAEPLRKMTGVVNVVVYDKTETPSPPSYPKTPPRLFDGIQINNPADDLTFWWRKGALMQSYAGNVDLIVAADGWGNALEEVVEAVEEHSVHRPWRIGSLQFWGHGADGEALMGSESLNKDSFQPSAPHFDRLLKLKELLHLKEGSVWFRCCQPFRGPEGKAFAQAAVDFFGVPVVGHTFLIWLIQSGTQVLKPGKKPDWPDDQGFGKKVTDPWSDPLRKKTISALRFYPPMTALGFIPRLNLLKCTRALLGLVT